MTGHSDYIVYVDESGDHSLVSIDPQYPVFVLVFCIFNKHEYCDKVVPAVQDFKFRVFGHDMVVFHEREIKKARGNFAILVNREIRNYFIKGISAIIQSAPFLIVTSAIMKDRLVKRYAYPENPYALALEFGLERVDHLLQRTKGGQGKTHIVVESRGSKEDNQLELAFRRICDGGNYNSKKFPFEIVFADKRINSTGLQLADLIARPIGRHLLAPNQENRAFGVIQDKFLKNEKGEYRGWGLKCFPQ